MDYQDTDTIKLPPPRLESSTSVEEALAQRRSIRDYKNQPLSLVEVSQLLWAAQGITEETWGYRTAPSAGALYPLEVYLVAGQVEGIVAGVYKYQPQGHQIVKVTEGDKRAELAVAALDQASIKEAAIDLVFAAVPGRTTQKYSERGNRYVLMEVGHAAQNVYLQAIALNLGTVVIGAFDDNQIKEITQMTSEELPLYIMPVGRK